MFNGWFRRASITDLLNASNSNNVTYHNTKSYNKFTDEIDDEKQPPTLSQSPSLKRVYKLTDLVYLSICNIVGSGIYVLAGTAGKEQAGAALLISLFFGLLSAGFSAFSFAEFSSRIPVIGGSYIYIYTSSGELLGFLVGFVRIVIMTNTTAMNAIGAIAYLRSFVQSLYSDNDDIERLDDSILFGRALYGEILSLNLFAPSLIFVFIVIAMYDVSLSTKFMNTVATFNMLLLVLFTVAGLMLFDPALLTRPCDADIVQAYDGTECPENASNSFMPFGFEGVLTASTVSFWAFAGGENVVSVAEESVNPMRDIPRSIYLTLAIVFVLFELVTLALLGMVPFQALDSTAPLAEAFAFHDEFLLQAICSFGAFSTMTILLFSKILAAPRYLYRLSVDGLLCNFTAYIHPTRQTPFNAIWIFGAISMFVATFFRLGTVLSFASTLTLLEYTMTTVGVLVVRYCPTTLVNERDTEHDENGYDNTAVKMKDVQLTEFWTDRRVFVLIWSYFLMCLLTAYVGFGYDFIYEDLELDILWIVLMIICGGILLMQFALIIYLDVTLPWKDWIRGGRDAAKSITFVPGSPVAPLLLIMVNCGLIASGGIVLLLIVLGLFLFAFVVYATYGYKHSKLGNKFRKPLLEMK